MFLEHFRGKKFLMVFAAKVSVQLLCVIQYHTDRISGQMIAFLVKIFLTSVQVKPIGIHFNELALVFITERGKDDVFKLKYFKFGLLEDEVAKNYWLFMIDTRIVHFYVIYILW